MLNRKDVSVAAKDPKQNSGFILQIIDWLDVLVTAVIVVVLAFSFLFRIATIEGDSMEDTLYANEKVVISNFGYTPQYGDIVVISRNQENSLSHESELPIIKRVIATEGQVVDIDFERGVVSVDGKELMEPYVKTLTNAYYDVSFPLVVKEGCIFVLGDNRNVSLDSRSSRIGEDGLIDTRYVLGRVFVRIFPLNRLTYFSKSRATF